MPRLSATRKLYITESNEQISVFILLNLSVTLGRVDCSPYSFSFFFGLAGHNTLLLFFLPISSSLLSTSCTPSSSSVQPHNIGALEFLLCSYFFFFLFFNPLRALETCNSKSWNTTCKPLKQFLLNSRLIHNPSAFNIWQESSTQLALNRTLDLLPQMYSFPNLPHFMATLSFWLLRTRSHSYSLSLSFPHFLPPSSYILNLLAKCGCAASLACYSSWGRKESDTTSWLNNNNSLQTIFRIWPLFTNFIATAVVPATPCCLLGPRSS